ncbi:MAG: FeoB-associated Cys-rich membrane protein [Rubripirellula sp.]
MDWQTVVASLIVGLAAFWLFKRMWRVAKAAMGRGSIPDCGNCAKNRDGSTEGGTAGSDGRPVVEIGKPPQRPSSP